MSEADEMITVPRSLLVEMACVIEMAQEYRRIIESEKETEVAMVC